MNLTTFNQIPAPTVEAVLAKLNISLDDLTEVLRETFKQKVRGIVSRARNDLSDLYNSSTDKLSFIASVVKSEVEQLRVSNQSFQISADAATSRIAQSTKKIEGRALCNFPKQGALEACLAEPTQSNPNHPANREIGDMLSEGNTALRVLAAPIEAVAHGLAWTIQTVFDVNAPNLGAIVPQRVVALHERLTHHIQERALDIEMSYGVPAADTVQAFSDMGTLAETVIIGSLVTKTVKKIKGLTPVSNKTSGLTPSGHMDPIVILEHNKIAKTPPMPQTKPNPNPFDSAKPLYLKVAEMGTKDLPVGNTALSRDILEIMGSDEIKIPISRTISGTQAQEFTPLWAKILEPPVKDISRSVQKGPLNVNTASKSNNDYFLTRIITKRTKMVPEDIGISTTEFVAGKRPFQSNGYTLDGSMTLKNGTLKIRLEDIKIPDGRLGNWLTVMSNLKTIAKTNNARTLQFEAEIINEKLYDVMKGRYGQPKTIYRNRNGMETEYQVFTIPVE